MCWVILLLCRKAIEQWNIKKKKVRVSKAGNRAIPCVCLCAFLSPNMPISLLLFFCVRFMCCASVRFQGDIPFNSIFKEKRCKINFKEKKTQTVRWAGRHNWRSFCYHSCYHSLQNNRTNGLNIIEFFLSHLFLSVFFFHSGNCVCIRVNCV